MMGYQTPNIDRIAKDYIIVLLVGGGSVPVRSGMTKVGRR